MPAISEYCKFNIKTIQYKCLDKNYNLPTLVVNELRDLGIIQD